jgi:high-affinity iron transporter
MLLTSVIIVLREFLEAALIVSVLLALGEGMSMGRRWVGWGIATGLLGALIYAGNTATVSDWLEGVGQEVLNALLQIAIYVCLALIALLFSRSRNRAASNGRRMMLLMTATVGLAIAREGSEVLVYLLGFIHEWELFKPILLGGMVGAGIGTSVGALAYYLLINTSRKWSPYIITGVIIFVAAGMASQAASLLIQADWLPSQLPLWDTSGWIAESSVIGQLLYALMGYEATPTPIQVAAHFGGLLLPVFLILLFRPGSSADA